ncbi:acetylornithine deacetylase [Brevibacillus reuszeri]|uniref:M20/M25/M40 family metallo-hydrolase n=1 Tax=Brevibacillus reuszeri TaxID=54915 RepID=UPI001B20F1E5|nr:M20/M25/M40 family metallo-hydrolase [Brevibacillus reuszeri]GIO10162.1 acetylornithine deacetylase [Brevibacillus reuszeri]
MTKWDHIVKEQLPEAISALQDYCRQPSISSQGMGIAETVHLLTELIREAKGEYQLLDDCGGNPVIYAVFEPGPNGNPNKTILFYNHYDVQPPEPIEEWSYPPFGAELHDGKMYARGVSDNKGDLIVRLQAISILQKNGGLPCRVKFLIEGEEEIGSPTLEKVLQKHAGLFMADASIWEWSQKNKEEKIEIIMGVKGMCYMQLDCEGSDIDIHSQYGSVLDNPAWHLIQALASMRTVDNRITVAGFYDGIVPPAEELLQWSRDYPFDAKGAKQIFGLKRPLIVDEKTARDAFLFEPTLTVCGIESGYTGPGTKTILPKRSQAKLDCRLVPGQVPEDIASKIRAHLDKHGFDDIRVTILGSLMPFRSDIHHPFAKTVIQTAERVYGADYIALLPSFGGSGPMSLFGQYLGEDKPIVSIGCSWWGDRIHAPNESIRLSDFEQAIHFMVELFLTFGEAEA